MSNFEKYNKELVKMKDILAATKREKNLVIEKEIEVDSVIRGLERLMFQEMSKSSYNICTEVVEGLIKQNDGDLYEGLSSARKFTELIKTLGAKLAKNLNFEVKKIAKEGDLCPECLSEISIKQDKEIHSHLDEKPSETIYTKYCENCKWEDDGIAE